MLIVEAQTETGSQLIYETVTEGPQFRHALWCSWEGGVNEQHHTLPH